MKKRIRELFRHFDRHALDLLEKMLVLDPAQRISTDDALDAEYSWIDPLPCEPKSLPKYESSHEFQTKKRRQQQRQNEEIAKRQKLQHPQQHARLPPIQQSGQSHPQHWVTSAVSGPPPLVLGSGTDPMIALAQNKKYKMHKGFTCQLDYFPFDQSGLLPPRLLDQVESLLDQAVAASPSDCLSNWNEFLFLSFEPTAPLIS
ncbi:[pyruvate dehydrogenase (acetyl-transferring)] kinase [Salvia divinorum]|uniref:[pyruvate dehydrogenase (Acetyl-transferring)] kinase n=1 Tax=Salvia divinorum TaxID=28513 RepID=A0ABD1FY18_SALDI